MKKLILFLSLITGLSLFAQDYKIIVLDHGYLSPQKTSKLLIVRSLPDSTVNQKIIKDDRINYSTTTVRAELTCDTVYDRSGVSEKQILDCYLRPGDTLLVDYSEQREEYNFGWMFLKHKKVSDIKPTLCRYDPPTKTLSSWVKPVRNEITDYDWWLIIGAILYIFAILTLILIDVGGYAKKWSSLPKTKQCRLIVAYLMSIVILGITTCILLAQYWIYGAAAIIIIAIAWLSDKRPSYKTSFGQRKA